MTTITVRTDNIQKTLIIIQGTTDTVVHGISRIPGQNLWTGWLYSYQIDGSENGTYRLCSLLSYDVIEYNMNIQSSVLVDTRHSP